ncbi:MAG: BamA/TamA family outer membrane protein [Thermoanaerobaculia bacterium]
MSQNRSRVAIFFPAALILLLGIAFAVPATAQQYFGRNKVQWESFDFKVMKTPHFDIYYYGNRAPIEDVGRMAERWYARYEKAFGRGLSERKPIVIYQNQADFQQTTTTGGLIGQGTGGFTDFFRNRIVMPLTGDYADTDHVLGHEMVHVFEFDLSSQFGKGQVINLPLWAVEGLAEYFSQGRIDPQTAMWVRDAAIHDKLPDLRKLTTDPRFSPYQYGQAFWAYIGGRYGDAAVAQLFFSMSHFGIEQGIERVLGVPAKQVFEEWHNAVKSYYQPVLDARQSPKEAGITPLLGKETTGADLNIAPSVSPDGSTVAFLSSRGLFSIDLYLADTSTGKVTRRLVSAQSNPHFDALRFIDSSGSWSPDGQKLAFVVFEKGDNRLDVVDVGTRKVEKDINIKSVDAMANPAWSPDGHSIAFSGTSQGLTDLWIYDLTTGQTRRLMNDAYGDLEPAWSPDGTRIAWVSDRGPGTDLDELAYHPMRIWMMDVASGKMELLPLFDNAEHINPQFSPDGHSLYFIADPEGVPDVFEYSFDTGAITRITHVETGVSGITDLSPALTVSARTGRILYSLFENGNYAIYQINPGEAPRTAVASAAASLSPAGVLPPLPLEQSVVTTYLQSPSNGLPAPSTEFATGSYRPSFSLEYVGPPTVGVGTDRFGTGIGGSVSAYWGDMLDTQQIGLAVQTNSVAGNAIGDQIGAQVMYLNQKRRINWGGTATHLPYVTGFTTVEPAAPDQPLGAENINQYIQTIRIDDLAATAQYPFSLTRRIEASGGYTHYGFSILQQQYVVLGNQIIGQNFTHLPAPDAITLYHASTAFVGDSSFYGFVSPIRGTRYRYEAEAYTGDLKYETALADWRRYFFLQPVTIAVRGLHYGRYGTDAEDQRLSPLYIGYEDLVRGYDINSFDANECTSVPGSNGCPQFDRLIGSKVLVGSLEVRVPLFGTKEFGLINFPSVPTELAGFVDGGAAWSKGQSVDWKYATNTTARVPVFSYGVAARLLLGGYIPLEFYWAKPLQRPEKSSVFGFLIAPGW